jgi:hypothetical protein
MVAVCWTIDAARGDDCTVRAPSSANSFLNHFIKDGCTWTAPLRKSFCFAIYCYLNIATLVIDLFGCRSPSDVSRLVVSICVDAINGIFWSWFHSDFGKELFKGCETKLNAPSSIVTIRSLFRVLASLFSSCIGFVLARVQHAVFKVCVRNTLAEFCSSSFKTSGINFEHVPAIAFAKPKSSFGDNASKTYHQEFLVRVTNEVLKAFGFWKRLKHNVAFAKILRSHDNSRKFDWSESHAGSSLHGFRHSIATC